jgi:hypothetical protein
MDLRAIAFREAERKYVPKAWSLPGAMIDVCPDVLQYYYQAATDKDAFFMDGAGLADLYNPGMFGIRLKPELREKAWEQFLELTSIYLDRMGLGVVRPFDPTMSIRRERLETYVDVIPDLTAIFTGYNAERGLPPDAPMDFLIDDVPVFRTTVSSASSASDEENAGVLRKGILEATPEQRPAFLNVFVLGNYTIHRTRALQLVMEQLPDEYEAVRPEHFAALYRQAHDKTKKRE